MLLTVLLIAVLFQLCSGGSRPVKTVTLPMSFACFRMPSSKGVQLEKRVEAGETLAEIMAKPTVFSKPISQIKECTGDYPEHLVSGGEENYRVSARSGF